MEITDTDDISNKELYNKLLNVIKTENERLINTIREEIAAKNKIIIQKIEKCSDRITELEKDHKFLKTRNIDLERQLRKNNLLIYGLDVPSNTDIVVFVLNNLNNLLEVDILVTDVKNLYQVKNGHKNFIKLELVSCLKKI